MNHLDTEQEQLVARVVSAVLRELGYGPEPQDPMTYLDPEARITDPDARRKLYGNPARSTFWALMKRPDAPPGNRVGRSMVRKVRDHLKFIASHPDL
jgi:hypothetical protein